MDEALFENLKQGLKEVAAIRRGEIAPGRVTKISAPDVKSIRAKVGLSQTEFSKPIGVKVTTLKN